MICYMPFSYISPERLHRLGALFHRFTVYASAEYLITEPMRRMEKQGMMDIRFARGVDGDRLQRVINEFDAWADLHRGDMASLRDFFKISQGAPPLVNETDATQISTRIRHFETPTGNASGDSLFQAALFLALAHRYDAQQETLGSELGAIQEMEQRMFSRMSGNDDLAEPLDAHGIAHAKDVPVRSDADFFMLDRRIRAWATLAAADPEPAWAFVTSSRQVLDNLLEDFPEAYQLAQWQREVPQPDIGNEAEVFGNLPAVLKNLVFSRDMKAETLTLPEQTLPRESECDIVQFALFGLPGCNPRRALSRMRKGAVEIISGPPVGPSPPHTLLGCISRVR
jgi:hypothetical protein